MTFRWKCFPSSSPSFFFGLADPPAFLARALPLLPLSSPALLLILMASLTPCYSRCSTSIFSTSPSDFPFMFYRFLSANARELRMSLNHKMWIEWVWPKKNNVYHAMGSGQCSIYLWIHLLIDVFDRNHIFSTTGVPSSMLCSGTGMLYSSRLCCVQVCFLA
ncbi:hypothetical protein HOY80DRAFT_762688 [Tuber brumale]|nr:hypothetical protein HOY80DRAFT_762688 [Tuber brumale]